MRSRARRNLVEQTEETFRPPVFKPNTSLRNRIENVLRRFLDLQAGSGWRDVKIALRDTRGTLLDIGCGAQVYRELVPAQVAYRGIDRSDAKARFGYQLPDVDYFHGDEWGVADESYDVALCTEVLEHVPDPAEFLARTRRCLRPGGRLVLTVPFAARWHFIPHDYWRYTPASLDLLLKGAGFVGVHVKARGNPLTVACYKVMALHFMLLPGSGARGPGLVTRALGLLLLPGLFIVAAIANLSLMSDWGDDCLGYTVTARRSEQAGFNA